MVAEKSISEFVGRLRDAAGTNLVSVDPLWIVGRRRLCSRTRRTRICCACCGETSFAAVAETGAGGGVVDEGRSIGSPLIMGMEELRRSADVFSIELLDMQQSYRVLWGEDVLSALVIPTRFHRVQLEYELREKTILLRQGLISAAAGMTRECGSCCCARCRRLRRCSVMLCSKWANRRRDRSGKRCRNWRRRVGFDPSAFLQLLDIREHKNDREDGGRQRHVWPLFERN